MLCKSRLIFLKGRMPITVKKPSGKPSKGNHIPERTDCPVMRIEEMPPTALALKTEPKRIPTAENIQIESKLPGNTKSKLQEKKLLSKSPPTSNITALWQSPRGIATRK